jgi:hypothetical protein
MLHQLIGNRDLDYGGGNVWKQSMVKILIYLYFLHFCPREGLTLDEAQSYCAHVCMVGDGVNPDVG